MDKRKTSKKSSPPNDHKIPPIPPRQKSIGEQIAEELAANLRKNTLNS
ncbi:MAG: hypothetical protein WC806_01310 [Candidatus Gracilibacteria bacterium]|jgi:hypothetical protein